MPSSSAFPPSLDRLLRSVSRSFYVSMRVLPGALRGPVSAAYLLARLTDTVADAAAVPIDERRALLARLGEAIAATHADAALARAAQALAGDHEPPAERELLQRLPEAFDALHVLQGDDRADVLVVLRHIVHGQALDLERFASPGAIQALPNAHALNEYAYLVAGCVGEFWTDICARHLHGFATLDTARMRSLGRSFGIGLQLVNIVRDFGEDLAAGRCYLPADELAAAGIDPPALPRDPKPALPVWQRWQDIAAAHLEDGMAYAQAVNSRRVRAAVALPALIGRSTLARLRAAGQSALTTRVKVPRANVRRLLLRVAFGLAGRGTLQSEWDILGWDNPAR